MIFRLEKSARGYIYILIYLYSSDFSRPSRVQQYQLLTYKKIRVRCIACIILAKKEKKRVNITENRLCSTYPGVRLSAGARRGAGRGVSADVPSLQQPRRRRRPGDNPALFRTSSSTLIHSPSIATTLLLYISPHNPRALIIFLCAPANDRKKFLCTVTCVCVYIYLCTGRYNSRSRCSQDSAEYLLARSTRGAGCHHHHQRERHFFHSLSAAAAAAATFSSDTETVYIHVYMYIHSAPMLASLSAARVVRYTFFLSFILQL